MDERERKTKRERSGEREVETGMRMREIGWEKDREKDIKRNRGGG